MKRLGRVALKHGGQVGWRVAWGRRITALLAVVVLAASIPSASASAAPPPGTPCSARPPHLLWRQGVTPQPIDMSQYPRPKEDNGRGMHWVPTSWQPEKSVDRFVDEVASMKIRWVTILNEGTTIGGNDYLVERLTAKGIFPVMRIYTPNGAPITGDLLALVRHYRAKGVAYFQLYNEPNVTGENPNGRINLDQVTSKWADAARVVIVGGGYPGLPAMSPGGDMDDRQVLNGMLSRLRDWGQNHLLDCAWLPLHNYAFNRPIDYQGDTHAFLGFRIYNEVIISNLGHSLPMIATEGGTHVGVAYDRAFPAVDEARQLQLVVDGYRYAASPTREHYYFASSFWLIANDLAGGTEPAWESYALFRKDYTSPIVQHLRRLA